MPTIRPTTFDAASADLDLACRNAAQFLGDNEPLLIAALRAYSTSDAKDAAKELYTVMQEWRDASRLLLKLAAQDATPTPHRGSRA